MRISSILAIILLMGAARQEPTGEVLFADASRAAVTDHRAATLIDNYGNPDRFVKYIIRRPPVIA